ncbi:GPI-anchor transamidase [Histoplasma capsulatum G186AR]|uniref:GPI-anchor transamidase n=2 Tax=Ajellomyces capsulatus TaxID=5037 RepID=C0NEQ5_AJECG|nr:GPI-anchor transamidase [Histoplasma capsulatum G186AR]EEH09726.1 GPI-anchor transamidase [Histoplasma capsulatum G186AR]KAG5288852.1 GPI-anchor transamidase [Histoplasma capsulatum]QSS73255.1 GPI-anchor transamidase [Histoplasma capsulatum G186AR]
MLLLPSTPSLLSVSLSLCLAFSLLVSAGHTSNWAVLVSTSRFWFNYRHLANVLSLYRTVKRLGIPDSQIILMLPDDMACNPRNAFPGTVYNNADRALDLYGDNIEVDYRGYEVTVESFIRLLTDRLDDDVPRSKRLGSDAGSNVLVYMTGHGGDQFLKFQDSEEIGAWDLADAFGQMWEKKRYRELLFMIDTCQANTMYTHFYSPNIIATGSSALSQSSYSHHADSDVGVAVIDRWTYYILEFLETQVTNQNSKSTLGDLFDSYDESKIHSQPGVRWDLFPGGEPEGRQRIVMDFFGNVQNVDVEWDRGNTTMDAGSLKDDLVAIARLVEEWRRKEPQVHAQSSPESVSNNISNEGVRQNSTSRPNQISPGAMKMDDSNSWSNRLVGLSVLASLGAVWFAGSLLGKP